MKAPLATRSSSIEPTVGTELGAMEDGSIGFGRLARLEGESGSSGSAGPPVACSFPKQSLAKC